MSMRKETNVEARAINLFFDKGENIIIGASEPGINLDTYKKCAEQDPVHFVIALCSPVNKND